MEATDKQRKTSEGKARRLANLRPFKPGQSGNPKGRPKSVTLSEALRNQLAQAMPDAPDRTYAEEIARVLCVAAARGNWLAAREIADRTEGKPKQAIDIEATVEGQSLTPHVIVIQMPDNGRNDRTNLLHAEGL